MEVSTNVLQGITAANNNENVPDDCFPALVTSACQGILNQSPHIGIYYSLCSSIFSCQCRKTAVVTHCVKIA